MPKPQHDYALRNIKNTKKYPLCDSGLRKKKYMMKDSPHCEKCLSKDPFNKDLHINQGATFKAETGHFVILP